MERSIQEVARLTGTTSRTLRHYDAIGLLRPTRIAAGGMRHYDESALVRLQRILLLRELGLGLSEIAGVLDRRVNTTRALASHLDLLREERSAIDRRIEAVSHTIAALEGREEMMAEKMFDGFDNSVHEQEVRSRWGDRAWEDSNRWWTAASPDEQATFKEATATLISDWRQAATDPAIAPGSPQAAALADRHIAWLGSIPGTPASDPQGDTRAYVLGLAEMYVGDERFARTYGGREGAEFVRAALRARLGA